VKVEREKAAQRKAVIASRNIRRKKKIRTKQMRIYLK